MATLSDFNEAISTATGVDLGQVKLISRSLRENGQIPQKGRGLHAAHLEAAHAAALLLGVMIAGQQGPLHRVANTVEEIGSLRKKDGLFASFIDEPNRGGDNPSIVLLDPEISFLDALSQGLSAFAENESAVSLHGALEYVGVKFGGGKAYPWIQLKEDRPFLGLTSARPPVVAFGNASLLGRVQNAAMTSESKVRNGVLLDISRLLREDVDPTAYISYLKRKHQRKN